MMFMKVWSQKGGHSLEQILSLKWRDGVGASLLSWFSIIIIQHSILCYFLLVVDTFLHFHVQTLKTTKEKHICEFGL